MYIPAGINDLLILAFCFLIWILGVCNVGTCWDVMDFEFGIIYGFILVCAPFVQAPGIPAHKV